MIKWFEITNPALVNSPGIIVHEERMLQNIQHLLHICPDTELIRPHVKTHKSAEVTTILMQHGIRKFKCSTIAEADMLASAGATDILLAYQPDQQKASRLASLSRCFPTTRFSCLVDNATSARIIAENSSGIAVGVYIDVNVGMNRTGVKPAGVPNIFHIIKQYDNLEFSGLHIYDGHIHDNDPAIREARATEVLHIARQLQSIMETENGKKATLVMGGSTTFNFYAKENDIEVSPGTFIFWDEGYSRMMPELPFKPAAILLSRIVSIVDERTVCIDLGYKSIACENPLTKRLVFADHADAQPRFQNEEHLVVDVPDSSLYRVGDPWYVIPYHICPTVSMHNELNIAVNHTIERKWKVTARDRFIHF